jgi:hypothetical protein
MTTLYALYTSAHGSISTYASTTPSSESVDPNTSYTGNCPESYSKGWYRTRSVRYR